MKKYTIALYVCIAFFKISIAQQSNVHVKGKVTDNTNGAAIEGCNVVLISNTLKTGTITNNKGQFTFTLPQKQLPDSLTFILKHLNFHTKTITVAHTKELNIQLKKKVHLIADVTVHSAYSSNNKGNKFVYTPLQAASSISIIGEPDVIRHISSLPGVSQGVEGTLGLFVRGSNNGSNRIEFNKVPFYSYSHLLGMFSAFSPDVIEKTTFRPGGIPAQSGNLSSSLLQITPKKNFGKPFKGKISISPYMTGGYLSVPIKKDKLSMQIAGRTSVMPWLINQSLNLQNSNEDDNRQEVKGQVLDITTIVDYKLNNTNSFDFMVYTSNDYFDFKDNQNQNKMNWANLCFKAGWSSHLSPLLMLETTTYYSDNHSTKEQVYFDEYDPSKTKSQIRLGSELDEWSVNSLLQYKLNSYITVKAGINYQSQKFRPASEKTIYTQNQNSKFNNIQESSLLAGFTDINFNKPEVIDLTIGYRHTLQNINGTSRNNFDIRLLGDIYLTKNVGAEVSYDRFTQYYHVLEGLPTGWSLNVMIPSGEQFPEEVTNQIYSGLFIKPQWQNFNVNLTAGAYYRLMDNLVSYINTVNMFGISDATWEDEIDVGKGYSYGLEIAGSAQSNRFGATLAYTLSKANRQFSQINNGSEYPFKFDRRHILNLQSKYTVANNANKKGFKRKQVAHAVLSYSSGHNTTLPIASYQGFMPPYWDSREQGWDFPQEMDDNAYNRQEMTSKNGFSMKNYFRIDLAYTFIKYRPKSTRELSVSVFNVLNRQNPYLFFYEDDRWQQLSIAPIMPSIRWTLNF